MKGSEDYTTIAESFQDVLQEINEVQEVGFVKVGENQIPVELFLGGDYKFLLLIMGLSGATSHYSCLWCTIHKDRSYTAAFEGGSADHKQMWRNIPCLGEKECQWQRFRYP